MSNQNIQTSVYAQKVDLLLRLLPLVMEEKVFAVHGGTAINLFLRNLPRYSVDIDLTYIPLADRNKSIEDMEGSWKDQGTVLRSLRSENRPLIALYFFHLETGLFYMKSFHLRIHSGCTQLFLNPEKLIVLCDALASAGSTGLDLTGI